MKFLTFFFFNFCPQEIILKKMLNLSFKRVLKHFNTNIRNNIFNYKIVAILPLYI